MTPTIPHALTSLVYPNPFNSITTIKYGLDIASYLQVSVYDLNGRLVEELFKGRADAGVYNLTWKANNNPSGVYILLLETTAMTQSRKLVLMK